MTAKVIGLWLDDSDGQPSWIVSHDKMNSRGQAEESWTVAVYHPDDYADCKDARQRPCTAGMRVRHRDRSRTSAGVHLSSRRCSESTSATRRMTMTAITITCTDCGMTTDIDTLSDTIPHRCPYNQCGGQLMIAGTEEPLFVDGELNPCLFEQGEAS